MYKIALIGCGRIAQKHVEVISQLENAKLVSCCDIVKHAAEAIAQQFECSAFNNIGELLNSSDADLISICTPSGLHPQHIIQVARAGRHVLSEKPLGCSLKVCDEAIRVCDENNVRLFVVKQNRFNPSIQLLRKAFEAGRFGRIYMILSNVLWSRPQEYYDQAKWRGTWEFDGGCLCNQAAHYVDLVQWFGGAIEDVKATSSTQARRIEAEDSISIAIKFRNGSIGNINSTVLTYSKNMEGSLTILGEKGTVKVGGSSLNKIEHWEFADSNPMDYKVQDANTAPPTVYGLGHLPYYRHVLNVLDGKEEALCEGREGRKTVELIERAYRNAI